MNFPLVIVLSMTPAAARAAASKPLQSLVDAERAFAKTSVTTTMRGAFLAYLADDAVVFRPHPVDGKTFYQQRPESPAVLSWGPVVAEISAAGDMGYTSGPWEYRREAGADPVAFGHYVSIWKKEADGTWKVAIDLGIGHDKPTGTETRVFREPQARAAGSPDGGAKAREALLQTEQALADDAGRSGIEAAVESRASKDIRWYRDGLLPFAGQPGGEITRTRALALNPIGVDVSASGDFGYTYGSVTPPPAAGEESRVTSYYFRIWRLESGGWRVILDLDSPVPTEE